MSKGPCVGTGRRSTQALVLAPVPDRTVTCVPQRHFSCETWDLGTRPAVVVVLGGLVGAVSGWDLTRVRADRGVLLQMCRSRCGTVCAGTEPVGRVPIGALPFHQRSHSSDRPPGVVPAP